MDRVIDPLIADVRLENNEALRQGAVWRSYWIRLAGGVALLKVIVLCGRRSLLLPEKGRVDEQRMMLRTMVFSSMAMCALVALLEAPLWPMVQDAAEAKRLRMILYLIPQALPIAIPIGMTIGIFCGFSGRVLSARSTRSVLTLALAWSVISFATLVWLVPAGNQSFRVAVFGGDARTLTKGPNEMTLAELSDEIESYRRMAMGESSRVRALALSYHQRWSLACASAVLALLAIGMLGCQLTGRRTLPLAVMAACSAYAVPLFLCRPAVLSGSLPAFAGAWLPNIVVVLFAAILLKMAPERHHRALAPLR
jgi:hypothetical protein